MTIFGPWDELLHRYVNQDGQVNYAAWQRESVSLLDDWLDQLSNRFYNLSLTASLNSDARLALWINLYNALVIREVLKVYPISSIRPTVLGIPNWLAFFRFFQRSIYRIGNQEYSLNRIEHGILRPEFGEPRIHFALVCAAVGCPLLRPEAYQPDRVQDQLEDDAQRFINNPQKVRYEPPVLYCSRIFQWYRPDFLRVSESVAAYIQSYLAAPILSEPSPTIRYLHYDWQLNQQAH
ncbi:MAG: DUF547 domain-containing protein [Synechococcales cyanobacterium C42_A2020_086]|nr:DUF547 domain-containing protein [Synechococcales cyanobacterium C42_A2020_086]